MKYKIWFKRVVWLGILVNLIFALSLLLIPDQLLTFLKLGSMMVTVWSFNYSVLLILLSCFYIPAANDPYRYWVNAWLLVAARLIPATTFFIGVFVGYMPKGFVTLGIGDFTIGIIEGILLALTLSHQATTDTVQPLKPINLLSMSQAEIDDIYKQGSVGEIPNGDSQGIAIIAPGTIFATILALLSQLLVWEGKFFVREQGFFLNNLPPFGIRAFKGKIYKDKGWFCDGEAIILDYSQTSFIFQNVREEMREIAPNLYLAQVYLGKKRISNFTLEF